MGKRLKRYSLAFLLLLVPVVASAYLIGGAGEGPGGTSCLCECWMWLGKMYCVCVCVG